MPERRGIIHVHRIDVSAVLQEKTDAFEITLLGRSVERGWGVAEPVSGIRISAVFEQQFGNGALLLLYRQKQRGVQIMCAFCHEQFSQ